MSEHPTYRIESLDDFTRVPDDRLDDCLSEFGEAIRIGKAARKVVAALSGDVAVPLVTFTWIDDGENNKTLRFVDLREAT